MSKASRWLIVIGCVVMASGGHAAPTPAPSAGPQWFGLPVSAKPARIVSLAPSTTEILFAVGAGPRVVAVTRYCDYPPEVKTLPRMGGVMDLNLEAVLAMKPDLVVAIKTAAAEPALRRLGEMGLPVLVVPSDQLRDLSPAVSAIAEAVGEPARGREVVATFDDDLKRVRDQAASQKALRTLIVIAERPIVAAGAGSFIDGAVANLGLVNVVREGPFPEIGREDMLKRNPELIIDLTETGVPTVGKARIVRSKDPRLLRLSPRLPQALADLARTVRLP